MACLEMRKESAWWYGRWQSGKKIFVKNLGIPIEGMRPASVNTQGDRRFETSRARAQAKLEQLVKDAQDKRHTVKLLETIHEIQTGRPVGSLPLNDLYPRWLDLPRRAMPGTNYLQWAASVFKRFADYAAAQKPPVTEMNAVPPELAAAFMKAEQKRGVAAKTHNAELSLLKGAFHRLRRVAGMVDNPFDELVTRDEDSFHRKPFTPEELRAILDAARDDALCRPLIVTGMCTAMRRGDVCLLKWADVDMKNLLINVKTSKTGARVQIPMFPMLQEEMARLPHTSEFCFPEAAAMYQKNPDGINWRLKRVFHAAGFVDDDEDTEQPATNPAGQELSPEQKKQRGAEILAALDPAKYPAKARALMPQLFSLYMDGLDTKKLARQLNISVGSVSKYLHLVEQVVGFPVIRRHANVRPAVVRDGIYGKRENGLRRINQRGFHAFRATWVTLALTAGVPVELVRRVTGHTVTETVLGHYFQPGREQFRQALQSAMPKLLTAGAPSAAEQARTILENMSAKTWRADRQRVLALLSEGGR